MALKTLFALGLGRVGNACSGEIDEITLFLCFLFFSYVFCFVFDLFFAKLMLFSVVLLLCRVFCSVESTDWVRFPPLFSVLFLRFDIVYTIP